MGSEQKEAKIVTKDFMLTFIASFFFLASLYLLIPVIPLYMSDKIHIGASRIGLLMGVLTFASMLLRSAVGYASDKVGRKPMLISGTVVFITAPLIYIFIDSTLMMALALAFHGAGVACFHTASLTFIGDISPDKRIGKSMAWFQSSFNLSIMIGPPIGAYIAQKSGYNMAFLTSSIIAGVALVFVLFIPSKEAKAIQQVKPPGKPDNLYGILAYSSIAAFSGTVALGSTESFIGLYAKSRGISGFALFFTVSAGTVLLIRTLAGSIPDRIGRRISITLSLLTLATSLVILSAMKSFIILLISSVIYGTGFALLSPSISAFITENVPQEKLGSSFGVYTSFFEGGIAAGSFISGAISSALGYPAAFASIGAISCTGAAFAMFMMPGGSRRPRRKK